MTEDGVSIQLNPSREYIIVQICSSIDYLTLHLQEIKYKELHALQPLTANHNRLASPYVLLCKVSEILFGKANRQILNS